MLDMRIAVVAAAGVLPLFYLGCEVTSADQETTSFDNDVEVSVYALPDESRGIISGNGAAALTPELVTLYTPLAKPLSLTSLMGNVIEVNQLLGTVGGRTFLDYLVKCALPAGQTLTRSYLGVAYAFNGHVGMAPEWADSALTASRKRWLSACVLAHVNATATQVSILLRGDHPALDVAAENATAYTAREGAFYGDIFGLAPRMYACTGEGSAPTRVCAESLLGGLSACGFTVPGSCQGSPPVCEGMEDGVYESCHSGLILPLLPTTTYNEAISVYVIPG